MTKQERALRRGIRAMRTEANKELRSLLKTSNVTIDTQAFNAMIKNDQLLSQHLYDRPKVREMVRKMAKIDIGNGKSINYQDYLTIKENIRRYNLSAEQFNIRHADEIAAKELQKRYKKHWDIINNPIATQEDVDRWVANMKEFYASSEHYAVATKNLYLINFDKALRRRGILTDDERKQFLLFLGEHVKPGGDYLEIRRYYVDDVEVELQDFAEFYGFKTKWIDYLKSEENNS